MSLLTVGKNIQCKSGKMDSNNIYIVEKGYGQNIEITILLIIPKTMTLVTLMMMILGQ